MAANKTGTGLDFGLNLGLGVSRPRRASPPTAPETAEPRRVVRLTALSIVLLASGVAAAIPNFQTPEYMGFTPRVALPEAASVDTAVGAGEDQDPAEPKAATKHSHRRHFLRVSQERGSARDSEAPTSATSSPNEQTQREDRESRTGIKARDRTEPTTDSSPSTEDQPGRSEDAPGKGKSADAPGHNKPPKDRKNQEP